MAFLTTSQAAKKSGKTRQGIRWLIKQGRLPATMMGTEYLINEDDLRSFNRLAAARKRRRKARKTSA